MSNLSDKSAFPVPYDHTGLTAVGGLTLREHFAGLAMQGFCGNEKLEQTPDHLLARYSVKAADALIAELERTER
jgi:hypothetical protein